MGVRNLGAAVHRIEDGRLITGKGKYVTFNSIHWLNSKSLKTH